MKKLSDLLAKCFGRFNWTGIHTGPVPAFRPEPPVFHAEKAGFELPAKTSQIVITASSPAASLRPGSTRTQPPAQRANGAGVAPSFSPEFITRQELQRELNSLRRLIENRK